MAMIEECDWRGNVVFTASGKYENRYRYDKNNNLIYHKNSYGSVDLWKYDDNSNLIYWKPHYSNAHWYEYDEKGKQIEITKEEFEKMKEENGDS